MVRRPPSSVRRPSSTMLEHFLLRNRLADHSHILCGASLGRGNEILFAACGSHDQDGRRAHIWYKPFENLLLRNRWTDFHETWYVASGTLALILAQGRVHTKIKTGFSQERPCSSEPNFVRKLSGPRKLKFDDMMLVT